MVWSLLLLGGVGGARAAHPPGLAGTGVAGLEAAAGVLPALVAGLAGARVARLEAAAGGVAAHRGNVALDYSLVMDLGVSWRGEMIEIGYGEDAKAHLLILVHAGETARVAGLAALAGDVLHFLVGAVGEVAGVGVVGHFGGLAGS